MDWSTLVGVVIGGAISLATAYLLEQRRERAADARAAAAAQEEVRTAARLVRGELIDALAEIEGAWIGNYYPVNSISLHHWREHEATLARRLTAQDWGSVVVGVGRVKEMNRDFFDKREPTEQEMHDTGDHHIEITAAIEVLWRTTGDGEALRGVPEAVQAVPVAPETPREHGRGHSDAGTA
ncbi:MAG: hypothetical protein M3O92_00350 [Actinomycetota bacterium]|nr:hypothetical protein [Actinomycetota bacterium]